MLPARLRGFAAPATSTYSGWPPLRQLRSRATNQWASDNARDRDNRCAPQRGPPRGNSPQCGPPVAQVHVHLLHRGRLRLLPERVHQRAVCLRSCRGVTIHGPAPRPLQVRLSQPHGPSRKKAPSPPLAAGLWCIAAATATASRCVFLFAPLRSGSLGVFQVWSRFYCAGDSFVHAAVLHSSCHE